MVLNCWLGHRLLHGKLVSQKNEKVPGTNKTEWNFTSTVLTSWLPIC